MKTMHEAELAQLEAGSRNCGNRWQTLWVTSTCSLAGGLIGLAGGPLGASIGSLTGRAACEWICHYAS
ncbi:MAG: hypothetical protein WD423_09505 [Rhodothermales bacterium]